MCMQTAENNKHAHFQAFYIYTYIIISFTWTNLEKVFISKTWISYTYFIFFLKKKCVDEKQGYPHRETTKTNKEKTEKEKGKLKKQKKI